MTLARVDRRRITLSGEAGSVDLAVPAGDRLDEALRSRGLAFDPRTQRIIDRSGRVVEAATPGANLDDGGFYAVVDLDDAAVANRRAIAAARPERIDHGARWMLLCLGPIVAVVFVALVGESSAARIAIAVVFGIAAIAPAVGWALRSGRRGAAAPIAMAGPLALAGVAAAALVPGGLESAGQLSVTVGALTAATLALVLAICTTDASLRAAWTTVALLLVGLGVVWGALLLLRMPVSSAAAVTLGLVPLVLRAMPSALVNLPDGMFIDYRHFMSNRWSVRGAIPDSPASIAMSDARLVVHASTARLTAGTVVLALTAIGAAPFAAVGLTSGDPLTAIGTVSLFVSVVLALLLTPRHTSDDALRWPPRAAAIVLMLVAVAALASATGPTGAAIAAASVFVAAIAAAIVSAAVARGISSLGWSRVGDTVEWLAVALALPAALLAAGSIELLRGMMAG